jgi:hypothetical protein
MGIHNSVALQLIFLADPPRKQTGAVPFDIPLLSYKSSPKHGAKFARFKPEDFFIFYSLKSNCRLSRL